MLSTPEMFFLLLWNYLYIKIYTVNLSIILVKKHKHIVPIGMFHRMGGTPPEIFPSVKYDAPEEVGGDRKCFDSPIRK